MHLRPSAELRQEPMWSRIGWDWRHRVYWKVIHLLTTHPPLPACTLLRHTNNQSNNTSRGTHNPHFVLFCFFINHKNRPKHDFGVGCYFELSLPIPRHWHAILSSRSARRPGLLLGSPVSYRAPGSREGTSSLIRVERARASSSNFILEVP